MDRIKRALRKAEAERAAAAPHPAQPAVAEVDTPAAATGQWAPQKTRVVRVPEDVLERNRLVAALPDHELADAYRILRTRVVRTLEGHGWNSLAITSPATGCGKTLTAINLAISLARELTHTVLLVDLDLRSPSVHRYFEYQPEYGIGDHINHGRPLEEILFSPGIERLVILPGRESITDSSETLRSPKMVSLVTELKSRYADRLIIFDLAPMLAMDDAIAFAPYVDSVLMVAENGATKRQDLQSSIDSLGETPLIGTVLNRAETTKHDYYYGGYGRGGGHVSSSTTV